VVRRLLIPAVSIALSILTACGGGATSSSGPPPAADYSLSVNPASVTLFPGLSQTVTFSISGINGFTGQVNTSNIGVPLWTTEAVAGAYALWAGHQDANGPFWMDASATV
jgi:hypothetical protein